jgi:hypothetical protein
MAHNMIISPILIKENLQKLQIFEVCLKYAVFLSSKAFFYREMCFTNLIAV